MRIGRRRWRDLRSCAPGWLESVEKLEQLRLLENGIDIYVADAPADTIGVDTEEDLERAEAVLTEAWPVADQQVAELRNSELRARIGVRHANRTIGDDEFHEQQTQFATMNHSFNSNDLDHETRMAAGLRARSRSARFFYAVTDHGRLLPARVQEPPAAAGKCAFFSTTDRGAGCGFRPCKRCKPTATASRRSFGADSCPY